MFCKNCGKQHDDDAHFCQYCGQAIDLTYQENSRNIPDDDIPVKTVIDYKDNAINNDIHYKNFSNSEKPLTDNTVPNQADDLSEKPEINYKSKLVASLLAIFTGCLGIHNFYLGNNKKGTIQLLLSTIGGLLSFGILTLIVIIWSIAEGISILANKTNYDFNDYPLED